MCDERDPSTASHHFAHSTGKTTVRLTEHDLQITLDPPDLLASCRGFLSY